MENIDKKFDAAMFKIYERAKLESGYSARIFLGMLNDRGGLSTAKYLINTPKPSDGYTHLYERGRLNLTVEAMVVENSDWHELFTEEELAKARRRLIQYGYVARSLQAWCNEVGYEKIGAGEGQEQAAAAREGWRVAVRSTRPTGALDFRPHPRRPGARPRRGGGERRVEGRQRQAGTQRQCEIGCVVHRQLVAARQSQNVVSSGEPSIVIGCRDMSRKKRTVCGSTIRPRRSLTTNAFRSSNHQNAGTRA